MENFEYISPTKFIFGKNTEEKVGEEVKEYSNRILLHYGKESIKKSGLYNKVVNSLKDAGVEYIELGGVVPNPRLKLVKQGIELCRKDKIDFILAVGGGSAIDSAKAIAAGVPYEGDVWDFFTKGVNVEKALSVGVILTLPATGSEASPNTVITYEDGKRKLGMGSNLLRPVFAIMNPELTYTLPDFQTAAGISDMLAHIFERYFSNTENVSLTDEMCEGTMRAIIENAGIALNEPENYGARANLMWAGTIAHGGILGVGREEDWSSHRIEHELSAFYDITHGAGLAIVFPAWMKYTYKQNIGKFAQFGRKVWGINSGTDEKIALQGIEKTKQFFKEIGMPVTLKEVNINEEKLEEMAEGCTPNGTLGNFMKLKKEDVLDILRFAL